MPGVPDPLYVRARAALLDTVEALSSHRNALVPVDAQAVYLHTGDADLAVTEYTTDADFTVSVMASKVPLRSLPHLATTRTRPRSPYCGSCPTLSPSSSCPHAQHLGHDPRHHLSLTLVIGEALRRIAQAPLG